MCKRCETYNERREKMSLEEIKALKQQLNVPTEEKLVLTCPQCFTPHQMEKEEEMSNIVEHAKLELKMLGYTPVEEDQEEYPDKWIQENVLELLEVFSKQGHSGMSASYVVDLFQKLALYKTLAPITGEDEEWTDVSEMYDGKPMWQNKRCFSLFKDESGTCRDNDALIYVNEEGDAFHTNCALYTKGGLKVDTRPRVKFPYIPKTFYVHVIEQDDKYIVKDESELEEYEQYFN